MKVLLALLVFVIALGLAPLSRLLINKIINAAPNKEVRRSLEQGLADSRKRDDSSRFLLIITIGIFVLLMIIFAVTREMTTHN
jgi:lipopolysaccharide export LptBFGC system permease protein LptF